MNIPKKRMALIVLLPILLVGTAFALYQVWDNTYTTNVIEPIEVISGTDLLAISPGTQAFLDDPIYPGGGSYATILIHNEGNYPLTITVQMSVSGVTGIKEAGLTMVYSNAKAEWGPIFAGEDAEIVINTPDGPHYTIYSFTIGTTDYGVGESGGDSSYVKVQAGFGLRDDAGIDGLAMDVKVFRGNDVA